ncbi:polysaccharide pyruvyl transferase family protein [Methylobacterium sp. E-065]|nr:polysaccharide pyruvyl transferase family protein [Methylobacterium sp. E-065]
MGLGAQGDVHFADFPSIPEGTLRWLRAIAARAPTGKPNISVRGEYTAALLRQFGFDKNIVTLGCPSLHINESTTLGQTIANKIGVPNRRIAVAAGHPDYSFLAAVERNLIDLMEKTGGSYIIQATREQIALARGNPEEVGLQSVEKTRLYLKPDLNHDEFGRWVRSYFRVFFNIPAWIEHLRTYDLVVGTRIHGVMLALQAGTPAVCIVHDSRLRELCEISCIPYVLAGKMGTNPMGHVSEVLAKFSAEAFDENRRALLDKHRQFFHENRMPTQI